MSRSVKKGPYVQPVLLKRIQEMNAAGEKKIVKTWSRASIIFPDIVGHTIAVQDLVKKLNNFPRFRRSYICGS